MRLKSYRWLLSVVALVAIPVLLLREFMPSLLWRFGFDLLPLWVLVIGVVVLVVGSFGENAEDFVITRWTGIGAAVAALGLGLIVTTGWRAQSTVAADVIEVSEQRPGFAERMPLTQGERAVTRALQSEVGDVSEVTYVDGRWCGFLEKRQTVFRNEVTSVACVADDGSSEIARFNVPAPANSDGIVRTSTMIAAQRATNGARPAYDSVYAYIDNGEPTLVIPLVERLGGVAGYLAPAGVVTIDTDGTATYVDSVAAGDLPGPAVAFEVAEDIRRSLNSRFGFRTHFQNRRSSETLDSTEAYGPIESINEESGETVNRFNSSEFVLVDNAGRLQFVTPLTPLGASDNVSAYLVIEADVSERGQLPTARLYRLANTEAGPGAVSERVQSLYDADIDWSSDAGTLLTEVTPAAEGRLVATAVNGQLPTYRFDIAAELTANNTVGQVCVREGRGTRQIRCDEAASPPASVGALRGISGSGGSSAPDRSEAEGIEAFTTEELLEELLRREQTSS